MKKLSLVNPIVFLLALTIIGCGAQPTPVKPTPTAAPVKGAQSGERVIAEGRVTPVKNAALSFAISGIVTQVPIVMGDRVQPGQLLAQLDTKPLELAVAQAQASLDLANANLDKVKAGPLPDDVALAKSKLDLARAAVAQTQAAYDRIGGTSNPHIAMTQESLALQQATQTFQGALATYNLTVNHPTPAELKTAQAQVAQASAARDIASEQLKSAKLIAPFAGTIITLDIKAGEFATQGAAILRLADTSAWQIETTDLTELNVAKVSEGTPVTMTFDAIPDLELAGKVAKIRPFGESKQGDIVYTVIITPDNQDSRLRWNMTAKASIEVK